MRRIGIPTLLVSACLLTNTLSAQESPTRVRMQGIFVALQTAYMLSVQQDEFEAVQNRDQILDALDAVAANARQLEGHADETEGFRLFSGSLADDARLALRQFENMDYDGAQFLLGKVIGACFGCHSRLPSSTKFEFGSQLMEQPGIQTLPLRDQMTLAVAARQFDLAQTLGERILTSPDTAPEDIDLSGVPEDYLKITLRVTGDPGRAMRVLQDFESRSDLPGYLANYVECWIDALQEIELEDRPDAQFEQGLELLERGRAVNTYPTDRRGMAYTMAASALFHRFIESKPADTERLARAYYLLGVNEAFINHTQWPTEAEFYLETAIRLLPHTDLARDAYLSLEEHLVSGYTGSAGIQLPDDVRARLAEVRALVDLD